MTGWVLPVKDLLCLHPYSHPLSPGLWGFKPSHPSSGSTYDGLHPCGQDHRVLVWTAAQMSERWGSLCAQDSSCVCSQNAWHQCPTCGGPGILGPAEGFAVRFEPHGKWQNGLCILSIIGYVGYSCHNLSVVFFTCLFLVVTFPRFLFFPFHYLPKCV